VTDLYERIRAAVEPMPFGWEPGPERRAAVLLPVFSLGAEEFVLFTVRRPDLKQHAGQIAFPGGLDEGDPDPGACALRETHEEVGIEPHAVEILGHLRTRHSSTGYRVHCIVGRVPPPDAQRACPREVDRLLLVPASEVLHADRWHEREPPPRPDGRPIPPSPHFDFGRDVIWGLTGRFMFDLVQALARS
jgi:8-oxo-dGTP pyrophosphatase MutT (NUDIX family)